eukprot:Awhi_evm2s4927
MVTMDMTGSRLTRPLIVLTGTFAFNNRTLLGKYVDNNKARVLFNKSHWMTNEIAIIYLSEIKLMYPGRKIGLIWDYAAAHFSEEVIVWLENDNATNESGTIIILEYVDRGLTCVYQMCDITINRPLKSGIKRKYECHRYENRQLNDSGKYYDHVVTRDDIISFISEAYAKINSENLADRYIARSFDICGLNPYDTNLDLFKKHLDSLSECQIYKNALECQQRLN